jgi:hypothetical protein
LPPKIVTAPSDLFDNNKPGNSISGNNIFISPSKWDPIKNGKLPVVPQDEDCNDMIPGKITNRLKRQKEQNERAMHNLLSKSTRPRQKLCQPYVSVPMGLSSKSADWNKKESDKWCRKNNPDWCRGRQIIDTNGHVIKKANNNVDNNMIPYINEDDGKQLARSLKGHEVGRNPRQGGPRPCPQPPPQHRGSSSRIRTHRGIKLGLASPDLSQRFAKLFLHLLFHCSILFAYNTPF